MRSNLAYCDFTDCRTTYSSSKWKSPSSPFQALTIFKSTATSVGDALRDLDSRDVITGDFLFVAGDVVSNIAIEPILTKHRARREKDKNAIMTMVLREVDSGHRMKSKGRQPAFVIDPEHDRCLHYEEIGSRSGNERCLNLDPDVLTSHDTVEVRTDLVDCQIDICTPDVLGLWSDNFDYTTVRRSFLYGVLKDYELNGKTIHTYVIAGQYAARAQNLRMYDAISRDIIGRYTYPLCPDSNLVEGQSYHLEKSCISKEQGVSLARTSRIKKNTTIGQGTTVGERSTIGNSTFGRWCHVGSDATISGSYIWDNVSIGHGTTVGRAIIANEAVIGKNCTVEPGAVISFGVQIADNTTVPRNSRITRNQTQSQDTSTQTENEVVGSGGQGFSYKAASDDESDVSSILGDRSIQDSLSESSVSEFSETESEIGLSVDRSRRSSFRSDVSEESAPNRDFHTEETASVLDGLQKGELPENIFLELNARRMGVNASQHEVRRVVVAAFMRRISALLSEDNQQKPNTGDAVHDIFSRYQELVRRTIFDKDQEEKPDQVDFLLLVQKEASGRPKGDNMLVFIAKEVYELELIEEEGILQWWEDRRSSEGDMAKVRIMTEQFITFLKEAEEEEDSEDESEED